MRTAEIPAPAAITEIIKAIVAIVDTGIIALSPFTFFHPLLVGYFYRAPAKALTGKLFTPPFKKHRPTRLGKASIQF